mmetsp:Transcript_10509/g.16113  ORF Transcript_10509/g.16113 Transcript_10509/m.16113 type:complete len:649 (+) Transcript_10509:135-2081(+)
MKFRPLSQWSYRTFGKTTIHLQHEFYLLLALSVLTASSFQAVYRHSFGAKGDILFWLMTTAWLSRHIVLRWICTQDTSTTRSPTFLGVISHWVTSHITAGQYFDRPEAHIVARSYGNVHGSEETRASIFETPSVASLRYTMKYGLALTLYPIQRACERILGTSGGYQSGGNFADFSHHGSSASGQKQRKDRSSSSSSNSLMAQLMNQQWVKFLSLKGPPLQLCLVVIVASWCIWNLLFYESANSSVDIPYMPITMSGRISYGNQDGVIDGNGINSQDPAAFRNGPRSNVFGASYARHEPPTWMRVFFFLSCGSLSVSIFMFGRIFLPIPDLVAGTSPLKAVRAEARTLGSQSSSGKKARSHKENQDSSWSEQYFSIAWDNRLRLFLVCCFSRVVENVVVCAFIPRTSFACRRTGHCPPGPVLWELSAILYPSGITSSGQPDRAFEGVFQSITPDRGTAIMTVLSVIIITGLLLLVQATTLDKSYLAIMGYISGEWTVVDSSSNAMRSENQPTQWDPRRRYKKGDLILQSSPGFGGSAVYRATSNSPEGRPFDLYLRAAHDFFRNELGHPGTSYIIYMVSKAHLAFISLVCVCLGWYVWKDYNYTAMAMVLISNLIASYGMVNVGRMDYSELATIGNEMSKQATTTSKA